MDRRSQPAMRVGGGGARAPEEHPHHDYRVLTRSWAITRLVGLVVVCGLGVAGVVAIFFLLLSVAIDQV
jgi:hypothetical protein